MRCCVFNEAFWISLLGCRTLLGPLRHDPTKFLPLSQLIALLHLLYHCPHIEHPGVVPFKDLFKTFRAVKLKLPGTLGTLPPGFKTTAAIKPGHRYEEVWG